MTLYTDNLYKFIIQENAPYFPELRILSGYGSAPFLRKVATEFPNLKIDLYLGMTLQGVSQQNHDEYCKLMNQNSNLRVFYQIKGIQSHVKLIEFKTKNSSRVFVGSANFTENGFVNQRELMTEVSSEVNGLFDFQKDLSIECTFQDITEYILFFQESASTIENQEMNSELSNSESNNIRETDMEVAEKTKLIQKTTGKKHHPTIQNLRAQVNYSYYNKFSLEIVLDENNNPRWLDTGINSWVNGKTPVLTQTPKVSFDKLFPVEKIVEVFADDGNQYKGKLTGRFNGSFMLINGNFYEYIKKNIGLKEYRAISREDLLDFGYTELHFERIDELKYIMTFGLKD